MSLGLFKKAWNKPQLEDLKNYFSLAGYLLKLDSNNTVVAIRGSRANINGKSGVVEITLPIDANSVRLIVMSNTSITTSSVVFFSLRYSGSTGSPYVAHYAFGASPSSTALGVYIVNNDLVPTNGTIFLNFLIVN